MNSETKKLAFLIAENLNSLLAARWLKLKEAAIYSGIGRNRLKILAERGEIIGFSDPDSGRGDWIFDKNSIDEYRKLQSGQLRQKALEIMGRK